MRVVAYTRRSTDRQEDSQSTQESSIREYCIQKGFDLLRVYHEAAISGSTGIERRTVLPELFDAVKDKRRDFDGIIVLRMDRLFRNPGEEYRGLEILKQYNCQVISICDPIDRDSATGRLIAGIMSHIRAFERELTGERIYLHNMTRVLSGKWATGQPPLGFNYDTETQTISANDRAGDAIRVFQEFISASGNSSKAARQLNAAGLTSRDGNSWRDDSVLYIVKSPIYRQRLRYDGHEVVAAELIPEIIPKSILAQVDGILKQIGPLRTRQRAATYPYSGLLTCSSCGSRLKHNGNRERQAWVCRAKKEMGTCDSRSVANTYIDNLVGQAIELAVTEYRDMWVKRTAKTEVSRASKGVVDQRKRLNLRRDRIIESYIDGVIKTREERDRRLAEINAELALLGSQVVVPDLNPDVVNDWLSRGGSKWAIQPSDLRREMLTAIGARITICTARDTPLWLDLDTDLGIDTVHVVNNYRNRKGDSLQVAFSQG